MERITFPTGLNSETSAQDATQPWRPWRPWLHTARRGRKSAVYSPYEKPATAAKGQHCDVTVMTHPVKLFWPRSRCFDYLYGDAEILLRSYPLQATICLYEDSDSDDDDDSDEEDEKELN